MGKKNGVKFFVFDDIWYMSLWVFNFIKIKFNWNLYFIDIDNFFRFFVIVFVNVYMRNNI